MSIIGEALHEDAARSLAKIMMSAAKDPKWGSVRSAVKGFARDELYPLYMLYMGEVFGTVEFDAEIQKIYGPAKES